MANEVSDMIFLIAHTSETICCILISWLKSIKGLWKKLSPFRSGRRNSWRIRGDSCRGIERTERKEVLKLCFDPVMAKEE